MIQTGFESKVKIQQILDNQLPDFVRSESPTTIDFLKQYYISQEYQGGPVDISDNLSEYLKLDNLTPEVVVDSTTTVGLTTVGAEIIEVSSTKGFPSQYGLLKIGDEIITYTGLNVEENKFTGCKRGFCGITSYHEKLNYGELVFNDTTATEHDGNSTVQNLSSLFLKEFYKKQKYTLTPDLIDVDFAPDVNVGNFIKESRSLYEAKGTEESFRILFNVLYGETPKIVDLEDYLIKPSFANYIRREVIIADVISGDPLQLVGQTIFKKGDTGTNASISEVEPFSRVGVALTTNKQYWKISLFMGYDESASTIQGNFTITPSTKCLETVSVGSSVISVDSTIGFSTSGTIVSGINTNIKYTDKSINQFFGCDWGDGIKAPISSTDDVRNDDIYFGYENGDISKKVEMRLTGVLSKFKQISENIDLDENQIISVKNVGKIIEQKKNIGEILYDEMSYKEIFANSWIYNTSTRYAIESVEGSSVIVKSEIYDSSIKKGDKIEILQRGTNNVIAGHDKDIVVTGFSGQDIALSDGFSTQLKVEYDIRRRINYAASNEVPLQYNNIISDTQNLYVDDDNSAYVASNSLPSAAIAGVTTNFVNTITVGIQTAVAVSLSGKNESNGKYSIVNFDNSVPFIDGDEVFYDSNSTSYDGLETGNYFVSIVENTLKKKIKLYSSRSFIEDDSFIEFGNLVQSTESNIHNFTLASQKSNLIEPQKLFKKFSLESTTNRGNQIKTPKGSIGMLINGVEITNYKSNDVIYYGPLTSLNVLNGGMGYDVVNPPKVEVSTGIGDTALIQPVLNGKITKVDVDTQNFDISSIVSISAVGGNSGASLKVITSKKSREVEFKGNTAAYGGGINTTTNQITFLEEHKLQNFEPIIYKSEGSPGVPVGIGTSTLVNNALYYPRVINNKTIELYNFKNDAIGSNGVGINTVSFGNTDTYYGIHKFLTLPNSLKIDNINIIDGGSFTNRKLIVKPIGISTTYDTITFKNHGFNDGDIIEYSHIGTAISGLTTSTGITTTAQQYKILKIDSDSFRLADAGIAGTITSNYIRKNYISLDSVGTGYHNFAYPNISVSIDYIPVGVGTTTQNIETIIATPIVKGSIIDSYLYESGTGYGSSILNFEKKPIISIKNGNGASIKPSIINGRITDTILEFGGREYYSIPDLEVIDSSGKGSGADLRPIITDNKITSVVIINPGIGYSATDTSINVVSRGKNGILDANVRQLSIDISKKYNNTQLLLEGRDNLAYSVCGYDKDFRESFGEESETASNIIGWAYDGNPIYGPYGYSDPKIADNITRMVSGYELDTSNIVDRPSISDFEAGFFVDDYKFTNSGNLDENNGRFGKTPEFPNGIYAYFATIDQDGPSGIATFPYFVGNSYRSLPLDQNFTQSFDFSSSNLIRNTFPYRVSEENIDNDFIIETNEISRQKAVVETITKGPIDQLEVISAGNDYKINDILTFDETNTNGSGLISKISSLKGKNIVNVSTAVSTYTDAIFTWLENEVKVTVLPSHNWENRDNIVISGFSTELSQLNGSHVIGVTTFSTNLTYALESSTAGITTEIWVSNIPSNISIGSSLKIGTETLKLLGIYKSQNILKVERGLTGVAHTARSILSFVPDSFTISKSIPSFDSNVNNKVYFNPFESVGFGTVSGISSSMTFEFAKKDITVNVPTQRIYIENHPFNDNEEVTFEAGGTTLSISTSPDGNVYTMPSTVYITNAGKNTIGIKTGIGSTYFDNYFRGGGADSNTYSFESKYSQIKGKVERIDALVTLSTSHNLRKNDIIELNVEPKLSVGIGTSSAVSIKRQEDTNYILVDTIGFSSTGINTDTNEISFGITSHGLKTGDKISYSADLFPEGISSTSYYVYKVDDKTIKLTETLFDANNNPPTTIGIGSTGGINQSLNLINPSLEVIKTNSLVFDLSHSSLENYKFKLYYDNEFKNEFISSGSTTFNISGIGTVGISSTASLTLDYDNVLPQKLYYNLEKSGFINTADTSVKNYSEINFVKSFYNSSYNVIGVGDTTFTIALKENPEKISYASSECSVLSYTTNSLTEQGGIDNVMIIDKGSNYKKLPNFVGSSSTQGSGAYVVAKSKDVGNANKVRIINEGFEYSSDVTLKPSAYISPFIVIKNSDTIGIITITNGGKNYTDIPFVDVVDSITREKIANDSILEAELADNVIIDIKPLVTPQGLPNTGVELFTVNNSNGIAISTIQSNSSGIFTCWIQTPSLGFGTHPFAVNDEVFIEGISKHGTLGSGFNSPELGYKFGKVTDYALAGDETIVIPNLSINDRVTIDLTGISTNTGIAVTDQQLLANLINKKNYPIFTVKQKAGVFNIGEKLICNNIIRDLFISHAEDDYIKVTGSYNISVNDVIIGTESGTTATVSNITENFGEFDVNYMVEKNIGWSNNIGELNLDTQVTPDNDYYQNLSYAVQSSRTFDQLRSPVSSLLHTSGLKNFANVGIASASLVGIGSSSVLSTIQNCISDTRVDTIYNYDYAYDLGIPASNTSSSIKLKNKVLLPYTLAKSNQVLVIDSIKNLFSNTDSEPNPYLDLFELNTNSTFKNLLIRVSNLENSDIQMNELVILNDGTTKTILQKGDLEDEFNIGNFNLIEDRFGTSYLRFIPKPDGYNYDYDLKTIETTFSTSNLGIGTVSVGFVDLTGSIGLSTVDTTIGITTTTIIGVDSEKYKSFYARNQLINKTTNEMNYVETYITHDETDTYVSEYFIDTHNEQEGYSNTLMGSFKGDLTGSEFSLQFENSSTDEIVFKSDIVGIGTTTVGVGTYRFSAPNQPAEAERSVIYDTQYNTGIGTTTVFSISKSLFNSAKSLVEVSVGSTKALHQVTTIYNETNVYTQLGPILSVPDALPNPGSGIGTNTGIGTFGAYYDSTNFILDFHPDDEFIASEIQVSSFNTLFYTKVDYLNTRNIVDLTYGGCTNSANVYAYNALNGERINRKNFTLTSNNTPIFAKSFDPVDSSAVDLSTGKFTIKDHFFRTNEELIYTPKSTFVGVGSTPMQYKPATGNIDILPSSVFAIRNDTDSFYISTIRAGTAVTFVGVGTGNAHEFAMSKSNTKAIISINNIIQSPLAFVPTSHTLKDNIDDSSVGISTSRTVFALSGISTIESNDLLKIDNEYMKVINVGFGTTTVGPITGIGTTGLVEVERGFVGSSATNHTNSTTANLYRGSYNIVGEEIYFTDAPRGNPQEIKTPSNLNYPSADFNGRVYLRNNYDTNQVYDDISDQFTGIGQTFTLQVGGANTVGLGSTGGNGLLTISNIFQRPTADNNPLNNYHISEDTSSGVSSVTFTGIRTSIEDPIIINESDINQNELPRGGLIVSLGSTPGRGYALAEGARVYLEKDDEGKINNIVGIATTGPSNPITTSFYNNETGVLEVFTQNQHNFEAGIVDQVKLVGLEFTCGGTFNVYDASYDPVNGDLELTIGDHYLEVGQKVSIATSSLTFSCDYGSGGIGSYPRLTDPIQSYTGAASTVTSITNSTITIGVGTAQDGTVGVHTYINGDTVGAHTFVTGASNAITASTGGPFTAQNGTTYNPSTGDLVVYTSTDNTSHNLSISDTIEIANGGITFTCGLDNHATQHSYPRAIGGGDGSPDPASGSVLSIIGIGDTTFTVNVGRVGFASEAVTVKSGYSGITTYFFPSNSNVGLGSTSLEYSILDTSPKYYDHTFVSALPNSVNVSGTNHNPIGATYDSKSGDLRLVFSVDHGGTTGGPVTIVNNSLTFTCSKDNHATQHSYPRSSDPASGETLTATVNNDKELTVNVGVSSSYRFTTNVGINSIPHTYVGGGSVMPWYGDATYGSGYYDTVSVAVTDIPYAHKFVSGVSTTLYKTNWTGTAYTAISASYNPSSGDLIMTIPSHGMTTSDDVGIRTGSLAFSCSKDDYQSLHYYPRTSDPVAGIMTDITSYTTDTITVNVSSSVGHGAEITSTVGAGGSVVFGIGAAGTAYNNPQLVIPEASYDNLSVIGVSRLSEGETTNTGVGLLLNVEVGASSTVGIASTYFEVTKWEIAREGYAFKKGDVITPVGLVTDANLSSPQSQFQLTVLDTYRDAFSAWQFGQMDYIDSIKEFQDGEERRFELRYDNEVLSFETEENGEFPKINLSNALLIIINGVIQDPNDAYIFEGGSTFVFREAPKPEDDVAIFFYRGTTGSDSTVVSNVYPSLKAGDIVQLEKLIDSKENQDPRTVSGISSSSSLETVIYRGAGITDEEKTLNWIKQKNDKIIGGNVVSKARGSLEPLIYPTTKIIGKLSDSDNTIFVDDATFFEEDGAPSGTAPMSGIIVDNSITPVAAAITAIVSTSGTISSLDIVDGGIGYKVAPSISIGIPTTGIELSDDTVSDVETVWRVTSTGTGHWSFNGGDLSNAFDPTLHLIRGQKYRFKNIAGGTHEFRIQSTPNGSVGTQYNDGVTNNDAGNGTDLIFEVPSNAPDTLYYQCTQHTSMGGIMFIGASSGSAASATSTIDSNGTITSTLISNSGSGYTSTTPPQVLVLPPVPTTELVSNITSIAGFSGIITGIGTTTVGVSTLGFTFHLKKSGSDWTGMNVGNPISIFDTTIGHGVTSIDNTGSDDAVVGIGTTFMDNIYIIQYKNTTLNTGIITCLVASNPVGIATSMGTQPLGEFSWGKLSGIVRSSNPISIAVTGKTINSGLTTFPTIQRRGVGLRDTGALDEYYS